MATAAVWYGDVLFGDVLFGFHPDPSSQGAMNSSYYSSGNRASMGVNGMGGMSNMSNMSGGWGM